MLFGVGGIQKHLEHSVVVGGSAVEPDVASYSYSAAASHWLHGICQPSLHLKKGCVSSGISSVSLRKLKLIFDRHVRAAPFVCWCRLEYNLVVKCYSPISQNKLPHMKKLSVPEQQSGVSISLCPHCECRL